MNENRYAVGVDIGTSNVRVVIGAIPAGGQGELDANRQLTIVGVGLQPNQGMRKGTAVDINKVAMSVDKAIGAAERMSGLNIGEAVVSINGSHINGMSSHGLITVDQSRPITPNEIDRVVDAAAQVKMSPNREIISVVPHLFRVDNQDGVRDPIDMSGVRLEVDAYMVTALTPHIKNLDQVSEKALLKPAKPYSPAGLAAANIALTDQQKENGAVLIDIGHSTTNIVVYEDGDVIDIKVLPVGSNNITTDLAIGLKADLDVAEQVKVEHAVASPKLRRGNESHVAIRVGSGQSQRRLEFDTELVDDIVEARLSELFELINRELKRIKRQANLPGGAVLTGGGANLRGIVDYARVALQMNARVYKPQNYKGVTEQIRDAGWTTALGLLEYSAESGIDMGNGSGAEHRGLIGGLIAKIGGLFNRKSN